VGLRFTPHDYDRISYVIIGGSCTAP